MRNLKDNIICIAIVLALAGAGALGNEPQISGTQTASCLVRITVDPTLMPLNIGTVEGLIKSSGVAGKALRAVLEQPDPDMTRETLDGIEIEWLTQGLEPARSQMPSAGMAPYGQATPPTSIDKMPAAWGGVDGTMGGGGGYGSATSASAGGVPSGSPDPGMMGGMGMGGGGMGGAMAGGMGGYGGMGGGGADIYGAPVAATQAPGLQQTTTIKLSVELPEGAKPAAEEFLRAIVANLRDALSHAYDRQQFELTDLVSAAEGRQESAAKALAELLAGNTNASAAQVDTGGLIMQQRELTRRIQDIEMNLASMEARRNAIEEQIAITQDELDQKQHGDEITRELADILQTNEELLSNLEKSVQAGRLGTSELAKAKEGVMQARIELARRREELAKSAGGGRLSQYNSDLSKMAVDNAENKARLDMLHRQLDDTRAQLDQASRFDPKLAKIRAAKQALDIVERRVLELKRRLAEIEPPLVTVIGAN